MGAAAGRSELDHGGSLELVSGSTQMLPQGTALPAAPALPPATIRTNEVTASINTFGFAPDSRIDSVELQVLSFGRCRFSQRSFDV
jgi:hypothetical protein